MLPNRSANTDPQSHAAAVAAGVAVRLPPTLGIMDWRVVLRTSLRLWMPLTRERRYRAALAVLMGFHAYEALDGKQRESVDRELVEIFKPFGIYPWWRFRIDVSPIAMAAERAIAMARLGLPTQVAGVTWRDALHPWHMSSPGQLSLDFRAYTTAVDEAADFLESNGVELQALRHYGRRYLREARERQDA
jgi:hypothetical protein